VLTPTDNVDSSDSLETRFAAEPLFLQVVLAIRDKDHVLALRDRKRARHCASEYQIEGGILWHIRGKRSVRARAQKECVTQAEALILVREIHMSEGHFGRDSIKEKLMDKIKSPYLDQTILTAIKKCGCCKGFGSTHLHSLLEPITRRHPWELLVGDYLSISKGKGGYNNLGVYLDVYSQHVSAFKYKKAGTGLTTVAALHNIGNTYTDPDTFMADGGSHFNNEIVRAFCKERGIKLHIVAKYSAWVNGLVEGTNKILLGIQKRLCAPDLGEDEYADTSCSALRCAVN
jgi:transposase InsO family protein